MQNQNLRRRVQSTMQAPKPRRPWRTVAKWMAILTVTPVVLFIAAGVTAVMLETPEDKARWEAERPLREAKRAAEIQARAEADRVRAEAKARREAEARAKKAQFACLSPWDGALDELNRQVKAALRDPKSFEHVETKVTKVRPDGTQGVRMTYRARNGFGGVNVETATATLRAEGCRMVDWSPR